MTPQDDPVSRPVFRVSFSGPRLQSRTLSAALDAGNCRWEGGESGPDDRTERNRALVGANTEQEAIDIVREALTSYGTFGDFDAAPVRDARGEVRCTPLRTHWRDVDWKEVEHKATLSELERVLISTFLNAAEPTWIIVQDPDVPYDLDRVEAVLRDLERRGLVHSTWEPAGGPEDFGVLETWRGRPERMCHWWALTDEGWDLLGLIKSPGYH
jgi:hypothetical protein